MSALAVTRLLADPSHCQTIRTDEWTGILCAARAERLLGSLAVRLAKFDLPPDIASVLENARLDAEAGRVHALWEAEMARRALANLEVPVVLLKGTAYVAAGLDAGQGRLIGDLDIMVPRNRLDEVEAALLAADWEWVKPDPYDDMYYRRWMHELPPMIHATRDRMMDVHHTILPLTARPKPSATKMIECRIKLREELSILLPQHMVIHAIVHLFADGDLSGGLRNLWDIDRLCREFSAERDDFCLSLLEDEFAWGLYPHVRRALRLASQVFDTPLQNDRRFSRYDYAEKASDRLYRARLLARDGWGRPTRPLLRFAFYIRSHLIRMPLPLLLRHLWIKWRRGSE